MAASTDAIRAFTQRRKDSPNGAGHYHVANPYRYRVTVFIRGIKVAESTHAVILKEVGTSVYDPVIYIPKTDVDMTQFEAVADYHTHCPIKGDASYWNFIGGRDAVEKAAWSYEDPLDYSELIAGHLGFDQRFATISIAPTTE